MELEGVLAEVLELSTREEKLLFALIKHEGHILRAGHECGYNVDTRNRLLGTLRERGLIAVEEGDAQADLAPLFALTRFQRPDEQDIEEGDRPGAKLVLQPLAHRLYAQARTYPSPGAGLGFVYTFLWGNEVRPYEWGILGMMARELGLRRAVTFLLRHATDELRNPLRELLPLARAEAKGFRPATAPEEREVIEGQRAMHQIALQKRLERWRAIPEDQLTTAEREQRDIDYQLTTR